MLRRYTDARFTKKDLIQVSNREGVDDRDIRKFMRLTREHLECAPTVAMSRSQRRRLKDSRARYRRLNDR